MVPNQTKKIIPSSFAVAQEKIDETLINNLLIITFIINDNVEHQQINDQ